MDRTSKEYINYVIEIDEFKRTLSMPVEEDIEEIRIHDNRVYIQSIKERLT